MRHPSGARESGPFRANDLSVIGIRNRNSATMESASGRQDNQDEQDEAL